MAVELTVRVHEARDLWGALLVPLPWFEDEGDAPFACGDPVITACKDEAADSYLYFVNVVWPDSDGAGGEDVDEDAGWCQSVLLGAAPELVTSPYGRRFEALDDSAAARVFDTIREVSTIFAFPAISAEVTACQSVTLQPVQADLAVLTAKGGRAAASNFLSSYLNNSYIAGGAVLNIPGLGGVYRVASVTTNKGSSSADRALAKVSSKTKFHFNLPTVAKSVAQDHSQLARIPPGLEMVWERLLGLATLARKGCRAPALTLHGPAGVGKTMVAQLFAKWASLDLVTLPVSSAPLASLQEALSPGAAPAVVLLEGVDDLTGNIRLAVLSDALEMHSSRVVVITARSLAAVDPSLRTPQRFGEEVYVGPPDDVTRPKVVSYHAGDTIDCATVAQHCVGCVGLDIQEIVSRARELTTDALVKSAADHRSTLQRGVCVELTTQITWDAIGGLSEAKDRLKQAVEWPVLYPDVCARFKITPPAGILLYGPSGCGKTTLVRALAGASRRSLLCIDAAALFACYVGESEAILRSAFARARLAAPSLLFIDEVEAVCGSRDEGECEVGKRVLTTILAEMDGIERTRAGSVILVGATNNPELLDPGMLRPGRFDRLIHIPAPCLDERVEIFRAYTKSLPLAHNVPLDVLAKAAEGYTGADIKAACTEAALAALRRKLAAGSDAAVEVTMEDFIAGFESAPPSVTPAVAMRYKIFAAKCEGAAG